MARKMKDSSASLLEDLNQVLQKHSLAQRSRYKSYENTSSIKSTQYRVEGNHVPSAADSIRGLLTHLVDLDNRVREAEKYGDLRPMDELGAVIRSAREKQGLTIEGLAELADVGQVTVHKLEKGSLNVQAPKLVQVIDALGLELMVTAR